MIDSRAAKKLSCDLIRLPAPPDPIPFFDDEFIPALPSFRPLTLGEKAEWMAIIDEEDLAWALQWVWFIIPSGYACRSRVKADGPVSPSGTTGNLIWLHREINYRKHPIANPELYISDHQNGCPLDDRRENLEWATLSENARNRHGSKWQQMRLW